MIDSNEESGILAGVSLKGMVYVYKVRNPDHPSIETCTLEWNASIADILRSKTQTALLVDPTSKPINISNHLLLIQ